MLNLPISKIADKLRKGITTPLALCQACLTRVEGIETLNAFTLVTGRLAKKQATESTERFLKGQQKSLLDGIPIAIKDNFCLKDNVTTCGSQMLANFVPQYSATVVNKLESAGATFIGKTNLDEFAMGSGTVDSINGPTRNIWHSSVPYEVVVDSENKQEELAGGTGSFSFSRDTKKFTSKSNSNKDWYIAGGSSGGSAVAVASGACFAALGSDTGGSTRNPAAYCGVIGLKPTYGLVSRHGLIPLVNSMDVPGILARSVEDVTIVLNELAGHDPLDSTTISEDWTKIKINPDFNLSNVKIGIPQEYHCTGMAKEVVDAWSQVAEILEEGGATVTQVSLPHTASSIACYSVLNQCEVASNMARYDGMEYGLRAKLGQSVEDMIVETRRQGFNEVVRSRILSGNYFLLEENYDRIFGQAMRVRRLISEDFSRVWDQGIDILLTPTTLTSAPTLAEFQRQDNQTQCLTQDYCTQPANLAGIPAISIPVLLTENGLPLSLQLLAPNFAESSLLHTALWVEKEMQFPSLRLSVF